MNTTMKELKTSARCALMGKYKALIGAFLLSRVITILFGEIFAQNSSNTLAFIIVIASSLLLLFLTSMMEAGLHYMYLKASRNETVRVTDLFHWFKTDPDRVLVITLLLILINLLLAAPFLLIAWFLIRQEYTDALRILWEVISRPAIPLLSSRSMWFLLAAVLVWLMLMLSVNLRYAFVFFLLSDHPEEAPAAIMARSRRIMQGHRLRLFGLILSFAGLALLSLLSMGIGFLWLSPYVSVTTAFFYRNLPGEPDEIPA